jgi:hypothetical protein
MISQYDRDNLEDILAGHGSWFTAQLLRLIAKADDSNRDRLRAGFPAEVEAYERWYFKDSYDTYMLGKIENEIERAKELARLLAGS